MNKCWNTNEMYMRVKLEFNNWIFHNFCRLKVRIRSILKCLCVNPAKTFKIYLIFYMIIYLFGVDITKLEQSFLKLQRFWTEIKEFIPIKKYFSLYSKIKKLFFAKIINLCNPSFTEYLLFLVFWLPSGTKVRTSNIPQLGSLSVGKGSIILDLFKFRS